MKRNSWKTFLSVVLLLTMLMSMLPFAAFAEDSQAAVTQTEEAAKTDDAPKGEEKTGDASKADDKTGAAKTDEKSGEAAKDAVKDSAKDTVKDAPKDDAAKDESKDTPKDDTVKDDAKDTPKTGAAKDDSNDAPNGDTEHPPKGDAETANAQIATLVAEGDTPPVEEAPKATLIYKANGGTGEDHVEYGYPNNGTDIVFFTVWNPSNSFTAPDGKEFNYWNPAADGTGETILLNEVYNVLAGETKTLYAQWKPVELTPPTDGITLTYNANGGTGSYSDGPHTDGKHTFTIKSLPELEITAPTGFRFNGWNTEPDGSGESVTDTYGPVENSFTLYAQWIIDITLTYDANGGTGSYSETKTFKHGEPYTFTVKPRSDTGIDRDRYYLRYWTIDKDDERDRYNGGNPITVDGDTTLYAQWEYVPRKISVAYYPNTDLGVPEVDRDITEGTSYTVRSNTFRPPYNKHFVNWNTASDGSGTTYEAGQVITAPDTDLILVAQWERDPGPAPSDWDKLEITKTVDTAFAMPGDTITYTITVKNGTDVDMENIIVSDQLSTDLTCTGYTPNSVTNSGDTYTIPSLKIGETATIVITATVNTGVALGTHIRNTAVITSVNYSHVAISSRGVDTVVGQQPDWSKLKIEKTVDKTSAIPGADLTYTITVTNGTGVNLSYVNVRDAMPEEVTYDETTRASGAGWSFDYIHDRNVDAIFHGLDAGDSAQFTIPVKINKAIFKTIENTAIITSAATIYDSLMTGTYPNGIPSNTVTTTMSGLDISVTAEPTDPTLGETITYTVTVTNNTGLTLSGITINNGMNSYDSLSTLSLQSSLNDGWDLTSNDEGNLCNYSKDLAPGASASYKLTTSFINTKNKTATCTAAITSISADGRDPVSGNFGSDSATAALKELDWSNLKIEKTVDKDTARPGDTLTYTIKVTNTTGYDLTDLRVEDPVPANTSNPEASQSSGKWFLSIPADNSRVVAELQGGLAKGASETFFMKVTVNSDAPSVAVENTAKITSAKSGSDYTLTDTHPNGLVSDKVTTDILPALELSMSVSPAMPTIYQTFTYTVTVKNKSNVNMNSVYIHDVLPKDVSIGGKQVFGGGPGSMVKSDDIRKPTVLDVTITELAAGSEAYYIVNAYFTSNIPTAENVASITKFITGDNKTVTEGLDTARATAYSLLGLSIKKSVDKDTAKPGDTLIYTVEVNNNTTVDLTKLSVNDILPAEVTYDPDHSAPGDWSFDTVTTPGTVKATLSTDLVSGGKAVFKIAATVNAGVSGTITNEAKIAEAESKYGSMSSSTNKYDTAKTEVLAKVPVNVTVMFNGLKDVSQVPAGYKLTGADGNAFLKGDIKLDPAESKTGHVFRKFTTEEYVRLGQEYSLSFTQSGYDVTGYDCTLTTDPIKVTANDVNTGINVDITLTYTKENLFTYPSLTVRAYFKGLTKLPDSFGYKLTCTSAPEEATAFLAPFTLTPGVENGVPYLEFSAKDVTLQAGVEQTFSFTQSGYDVPGYVCTLGLSTFKFTLPVATTNARQPILLKIENTYAQPDWSKLTITKAADKTRAMPGSVVKYTVTVTNNTGVDLSNIIVADKLDSRLRYSGNTGGYSTGTGAWTVASLANGKSVTLTLTVKLKYALAAGSVIENTASVTEATAAGLVYDLSGQKISDSVIVTVIGGKGSPRTGDESSLGLWAAFMAASLACAGAAAVIYKKRRG